MQRALINIVTFFVIIATFGSCGIKKGNFRKRDVPIAINIKADNNYRMDFINIDYYRFQLVNDLSNFQNVNLTLVSADENPEVILDITVDNFVIWPKDDRTSRRTFTRSIQAGTDAAGKPIFQTVSASVDITQTIIRSNARFITKMTFKGTPPSVFERSFSPSYNYNALTTSNIQGDSRAIDPTLYSIGAFNIEPREEDFLIALSRQELIRRLSDEIRRHYQ